MPFYDAHNHLHDEWLAPAHAQILAELAATGVRHVVVNGTSEADWADVTALARQAPIVLPSYGLHPWDVGNRSPGWQKSLLSVLGLSSTDKNFQAAAAEAAPVRLGEFGLDRWMLDRARPDDPRLAGLRRAPFAEQTEVFLWQFELAATHNLPASIHCLDAWGHLHDLLRSAKRPARGFLLHAYSGPAEMVKPFSDLGAHFSFNGSFLDPRKTRLQELYAALPADRLLIETDAPAMRLPVSHEKFAPLPVPNGSLANHPANLAATYAALAALRKVDLDTLCHDVEANFHRLFLAP
jgi:TatD DNase family protein